MEWNGLPTGAAGRWMRNYMWEESAFPNVRLYALAAPCYHCENPVCVDAANGALYKEPNYGAVLLDPAKAQTQCADLRKAYDACPYGAIVFDSDDPTKATAGKCTMCIDRLEQGLAPMCVLSCDMKAFDFGPLADLQTKYGTLQQLPSMPDPSIVHPAAVFKPNLPRKQIVPYDSSAALDLWQSRGPYSDPTAPPTFQNKSDVTDPQLAIVQKNKLVMHHKSNAELLFYTTQDE
jgi:anaerobic dimethyl sulfoxide reductase subunit B (iron-sulfur subunit)